MAPLQRAAALNPLPEYHWVLADTLRLLDRGEEADRVEGTLVASGAQSDPRTLALFLATRQIRTTDAVAAVERELQERSDAFTVDALAWALNAAGRLEEADSAMARALATASKMADCSCTRRSSWSIAGDTGRRAVGRSCAQLAATLFPGSHSARSRPAAGLRRHA